MNGPAWRAIVPELVSPAELQEAVALNGAGFNVARAVGPALGGVIVAAAGPEPYSCSTRLLLLLFSS